MFVLRSVRSLVFGIRIVCRVVKLIANFFPLVDQIVLERGKLRRCQFFGLTVLVDEIVDDFFVAFFGEIFHVFEFAREFFLEFFGAFFGVSLELFSFVGIDEESGRNACGESGNQSCNGQCRFVCGAFHMFL